MEQMQALMATTTSTLLRQSKDTTIPTRLTTTLQSTPLFTTTLSGLGSLTKQLLMKL